MNDNEYQNDYYDFKPFILTFICSLIVSIYMINFISYNYYYYYGDNLLFFINSFIIYPLMITMFSTFYFNENDFLYMFLSEKLKNVNLKSVRLLTLFIQIFIILLIMAVLEILYFDAGIFLYLIIFSIFLFMWDSVKSKITQDKKITQINVKNKREMDNYILTYSNNKFSIIEEGLNHVLLQNETKISQKIIILFLMGILLLFLQVNFYYQGYFFVLIFNVAYIYYFISSEKKKQTIKIENGEENQFIFCSSCGTKLKKDDVFCKRCGKRINN